MIFSLDTWVNASDLEEMKGQSLEQIEQEPILTGYMIFKWEDFQYGWRPDVSEDEICEDMGSLEWLDEWANRYIKIFDLLVSNGYAATGNMEGGRFLLEFTCSGDRVRFRKLNSEGFVKLFAQRPPNTNVTYESNQTVALSEFRDEVVRFIKDLIQKATTKVPQLADWSTFKKLTKEVQRLEAIELPTQSSTS